MAGIVLCIGRDDINKHEIIRHNYEQIKNLKVSCKYDDKTFRIVKYRRRYDPDDRNYYESEDIMLFAVGTVLYKRHNIEKSITELGNRISQGCQLSEIMDEIDGTFCLLIINKKKKRCFIITDAGGVINTYFVKRDNTIYLSSSMLALGKSFDVTPDKKSILLFLRTGMFFEDSTYFKEISVLRPASIYEIDFSGNMHQMKRTVYWSVPRNVDDRINLKEASQDLKNALFNIIDRIPFEDSIFDFTGGYDSRFVVSFAYSLLKKKRAINAFFFGPPSSREAQIVHKNCDELGIEYNNYLLPDNWKEIYFDHIIESHKLSDGMISVFEYAPVLWALKQKRVKFNYSVLGLFGEIYRGFTAKQEFFNSGKKKPANLCRFIFFRNLAVSFNDKILSKDILEVSKNIPVILYEIYRRTNSTIDKNSPNTLQLDNIYFSHRMRRWGGRTLSTSNQIIQPICPLWFRKPLSICFSLTPKIKNRERLMKSIVQEISPEISYQKTISGAPFALISIGNIIKFIPAVLFYFQKAFRKFFQIVFNRSIWEGLTIPDYEVEQWYRAALDDPSCMDLLDYKKMYSKGLYTKKEFDKFIQNARCSGFNFYTHLGNILSIEMTLRAENKRYS